VDSGGGFWRWILEVEKRWVGVGYPMPSQSFIIYTTSSILESGVAFIGNIPLSTPNTPIFLINNIKYRERESYITLQISKNGKIVVLRVHYRPTTKPHN